MAVEDLSLEDVLQRAYQRALVPVKAIRLVQSRIRQNDLSEGHASFRIGAALITQLTRATPSALSLAYLSEALTTGTIDPQAFAIQILFRLNEESQLPATSLGAISTTLLSGQWGSTTSLPFPAVVTDPQMLYPPDIGTSASTVAQEGAATSTLKLLLPLLNLCAEPAIPQPLPITALVTRILSSLEPYPAPPLDVGLEASGLLPRLSEIIGLPLRNCLSGLMSDLAISQTAATLSLNAVPAVRQTTDPSVEFAPLPPTFPISRPDPPIPLSHMISFILTYALPSARGSDSPVKNEPVVPATPRSSHLTILRAARYLAAPDVFLSRLIEGSLQFAMGTHQTFTPDLQRSLLFITTWLPELLRYWKDTSQPEWPYPDTLVGSLGNAFEALNADLNSLNSWISATYTSRLREAENAEDGSSFTMVEGWEVKSVQTVMVHRMIDLELLDTAAAASLSGVSLPGLILRHRESLLDRVAAGSASSILVCEAIIASSPGAATAFATEFQSVLSVSQQIPLADNLLCNLASHPALLVALTSVVAAEQLASLSISALLDAPTDEAARADDPQGVLTRYGEGVVFIEALVDVFGLELPTLLARSRRFVALGHLNESEKACLNGWVKALFSSEGIDDHILLSTMPRDLCWLAPSIIHQAIAATAAGRLDRDTLHGGLSYFSQPLLSWCLGGIISWLSSEVTRNGLVSALYLDVLQSIVLSDSTPHVFLRINGRAISRLLDPQAGLSSVFQSASFDAAAVRAKMDSVSSAGQLWHPTPSNSLPLNVFRSQLHVIRHLSMTQHPWSGPFLADLEDCLVTDGPVPMLDILYTELVRPTLDFDRTHGDPLAYFGPLLCALPVNGNRPLVEDLITNFIPHLAYSDPPPEPGTVHQLCGLVKSSLLLLAHFESSSPSTSASDRLMEELRACLDNLQQRRTVSIATKGRKRKLALAGESAEPKRGGTAALDVMWKVLRADLELRERWPAMALAATAC